MSKTLDALNNYNENVFMPIIKSSEMVIGKFYKASSMCTRKTTYGKKVCLILQTEDGDKLLFLPPSYAGDAKKSLLTKLFDESTKINFISLIEIKNQQNGMEIPIFKFKQE